MSSQLLLHEAAGWHWWFAPLWFLLWVVVDRHDRAVRALASAGALRPARRRPRNPRRAVRTRRDRRRGVRDPARGAQSVACFRWPPTTASSSRGSSATSRRAPRRRRDRPPRRAGRDLRVPRAERGRQVDDRPHADDAPAADRRDGPRCRLRRRRGRAEGARVDRRCAPGGGARRPPHGARPPPPADDAPGPATRGPRVRARTSCSSASGSPRRRTGRSAATRAG